MQTDIVEPDNLQDLSQTLFALANVKRLSILKHLQHHEMNAGTLAECVDLSQSALSQHLVKLKALGVVEARKTNARLQPREHRAHGSTAAFRLAKNRYMINFSNAISDNYSWRQNRRT